MCDCIIICLVSLTLNHCALLEHLQVAALTPMMDAPESFHLALLSTSMMHRQTSAIPATAFSTLGDATLMYAFQRRRVMFGMNRHETALISMRMGRGRHYRMGWKSVYAVITHVAALIEGLSAHLWNVMMTQTTMNVAAVTVRRCSSLSVRMANSTDRGAMPCTVET